MADLWELVLDSSALPDAPENDLWDHLNNLGSGSGPGGFILVDTAEVELMTEEIDVELVEDTLDVEFVDDTVDVKLIDDVLDIEVG